MLLDEWLIDSVSLAGVASTRAMNSVAPRQVERFSLRSDRAGREFVVATLHAFIDNSVALANRSRRNAGYHIESLLCANE